MNSTIINDSMKNKGLCLRCKCNQAEIICEACYPFTQFCPNCDTSIHSMPSKQHHQRAPIIQPHPSLLNTSLSLNNSQPNPITSDYLNKLQDIHDKEREDLVNRTFSLEKQLDTTKTSLTDRITALHSQIEALQKQKHKEVNDVKGQYGYELSRLAEEKQAETAELMQKKKEVIRINDELLVKLHQYMETIEELHCDIAKLKGESDLRLKQSQQENKDLIEYYEKKLGYCNDSHNEDKEQLINSYENSIEKMSREYNENKQKMQALIIQRENYIKKFIEENRKESEQSAKENKALKDKCNDQAIELQAYRKLSHENAFEIDVLKKKIVALNEEKDKINKKHTKEIIANEELIKEIEYLKLTNQKMHRITHGVFKSKGN